MLCSNCGTDNEAGLKFCGECGTRLAVPCPSCSTANPPGRRFCGECGTSLETTSSAPTETERSQADASPAVAITLPQTESVAERKLVSVLFADLVDFTAASEARDPEEVRETLTRYFDLAREVIDRYGGSIEKFIGDAVMAVWGTPVAHEDDAERAVRAALELVDAVGALAATDGGAPDGGAPNGLSGARLHLRAAVITGEAAVTVGAVGQGMVAGDLVNTASRLQSVAPPDTVLVGEATYRATSEAITFEPVGEQQLKGKALPLPAWRAVQVFAMLRGTGRGQGLEAPFVGRDPEFRLLKELFHATVRERRLHLISVTGIAGIGKSRLAWEFLKYVDGLVEDLYWHQGRSPAYGEGVTFWALGEMVRRRAGIAETDDDVTTRQKLSATLADFVPDEAERRHIEPRLEALLGLAVGPAGEREELFTAWRSFFEHVARRGPTVLVFEELHWADAGVLDFIESLLDWSRNLPILILTLARPELLERRPTWGAGQRNFVALHLEPLDDEAMRQLLDGLAPGLPDALVRRVLQRAAGVPLYAVETVRMLVDGGLLVGEEGRYRVAGDISRLAVPETLHALIAARLDSLEPVERALLQDAAVLGQTFTVASLSALTTRPAAELEDRLRGLVRKEILIFDADPRSPERGQYGFVQGLIRDVAHDTLSRRDRRAKHLAAARYYEGLGTEELAAVLAGHYLSAHEATPPGPEADALSAQARVALRAAAERAASLHSHEQALAFLEGAETVTSDPAERAALWERMADGARAAGLFDVAEARFEAAIAWHDARHDAAAAARLTARLGDVLLRSGHVQAATTRLQGVPTAGLPEEEAARIGAMLGRAYMLQEDDERALEWIERALPAAGRAGDVEVVAEALTTKGPVLGRLRRSAEGVALLHGALALAESHGLYATRFRATYNLAGRLYEDDPAAAFRVLRDGLDLARRLGQRGWFVTLAGFGVGAAIDAGEWDWATAVADEVFEFEMPAGARLELEIWLSNILAYRGEVEAAQRIVEGHEGLLADLGATQAQTYWVGRAELAMIAGRLEDAVAAAERAVEATSGDAWWVAGTTSKAAFRLGDLDRVRVSLAAIEAAPEHGRFFDASADASRADILALEGRRPEASRLYADVIRRYRELGVPNFAAEASLDFVLAMGADDPAARAAAEEARAFWTRLGARAALERLDEAIARGPIAPPSRPAARSAEGVPTGR